MAILALYFLPKAISLLGPSASAIFTALVPPVSLLLGAIIPNEQITLVEYIGLGFACIGMLFAHELFQRSQAPLAEQQQVG